MENFSARFWWTRNNIKESKQKRKNASFFDVAQSIKLKNQTRLPASWEGTYSSAEMARQKMGGGKKEKEMIKYSRLWETNPLNKLSTSLFFLLRASKSGTRGGSEAVRRTIRFAPAVWQYWTEKSYLCSSGSWQTAQNTDANVFWYFFSNL